MMECIEPKLKLRKTEQVEKEDNKTKLYGVNILTTML